ncbi:MAG: hypothetical protein K2O14_01800 [Oscillospiraceae bacterium]|nr:hypothetical protein [Oscillospiraceae bacterium]
MVKPFSATLFYSLIALQSIIPKKERTKMKDLLNSNEPLTLESLREFFHEHDFSTIPAKDPSEYTEDELELYNAVLKHINAEWKEISKALGLNHPQDCYSRDFPPELIRDRM